MSYANASPAEEMPGGHGSATSPARPALVALITTSKLPSGERGRRDRDERAAVREALDQRVRLGHRAVGDRDRARRLARAAAPGCRARRRRRRAPAHRDRRSGTSRLTVRSRTMPAPSVLSAYQCVAFAHQRIARAGRLRALARLARDRERVELERHGDVEAAPAFARESRDDLRRSRRSAPAGARSSCPGRSRARTPRGSAATSSARRDCR